MTNTTSTLSQPRASISARLAGRCGRATRTTGRAGSIVGARLETVAKSTQGTVMGGVPDPIVSSRVARWIRFPFN